MLSSLLPGIREVRSPLVSGYAWILSIWLFINTISSGSLDSTSDLPADLEVLVDVLGRPGAFAALSFVALLVGSFNNALIGAGRRRMTLQYLKTYSQPGTDRPLIGPRWLPTSVRKLGRLGKPMSTRARNRAFYTGYQFWLDHRKAEGGDGPANSPAEADAVGRAVVREVVFMSPRLIVAKQELYAEYDRLMAESALRQGLLIPLPLLAVQLLVIAGWPLGWFVLAVAIVAVIEVALVVQADGSYRTAHSIIAHSIAQGVIRPAAFEEIEAHGEFLRESSSWCITKPQLPAGAPDGPSDP